MPRLAAIRSIIAYEDDSRIKRAAVVLTCDKARPRKSASLQRSKIVLPLLQRDAERDEEPLRGADASTALRADSTALGTDSTALGTRSTALGTELTAPLEESTAPPVPPASSEPCASA
jgi:hypothetical protein